MDKETNKPAKNFRIYFLFLLEIFLVTLFSGLFIILIEEIQGARHYNTHYSYYLFHLLFPLFLIGTIAWATGRFRPGRTELSLLIAFLILLSFFPAGRIIAALWFSAACLATAFVIETLSGKKKARKRIVVTTKDPVTEDPELRARMGQKNRLERKYRTRRKHARPIPIGRFWPIERI